MAHRDNIIFTTVGCQPIDTTGSHGQIRTDDLSFRRGLLTIPIRSALPAELHGQTGAGTGFEPVSPQSFRTGLNPIPTNRRVLSH
jgi:hypothetical protein